MSHGNHQGVVATAEAPLTCGEGGWGGGSKGQWPACTESSVIRVLHRFLHHLVLTQTVDALFGVYKPDSDVALGLVYVRRPIRGEVDNYRRCHHGMRKVGLKPKERNPVLSLNPLRSVRNDVLTAGLL